MIIQSLSTGKSDETVYERKIACGQDWLNFIILITILFRPFLVSSNFCSCKLVLSWSTVYIYSAQGIKLML